MAQWLLMARHSSPWERGGRVVWGGLLGGKVGGGASQWLRMARHSSPWEVRGWLVWWEFSGGEAGEGSSQWLRMARHFLWLEGELVDWVLFGGWEGG